MEGVSFADALDPMWAAELDRPGTICVASAAPPWLGCNVSPQKRLGLLVRKIPLQDRSVVTVNRIIDAASHYVASKNRLDFTIDALAPVSGVSRQATYRYFRSSHDILAAVIVKHQREAALRVIQAATAPDVTSDVLLAKRIVGAVISEFLKRRRISYRMISAIAREYMRPPEFFDAATKTIADAMLCRGVLTPEQIQPMRLGAYGVSASIRAIAAENVFKLTDPVLVNTLESQFLGALNAHRTSNAQIASAA